jgi:hypothetical protein
VGGLCRALRPGDAHDDLAAGGPRPDGPRRFLAFTFAGAAVWNALLVAAGYYLGRNFAEVDRYTGPLATGCMALVAIAYLWRVVRWKPREVRSDRRRLYRLQSMERCPPQPLPLAGEQTCVAAGGVSRSGVGFPTPHLQTIQASFASQSSSHLIV